MKNKLSSRKWTVYTGRGQKSQSDVIGDIFVYETSAQELVLAIMGVNFRSVPFKSLAKSLTSLNNTGKSAMSRSVSDSGYGASYDSESNGRTTAISSPPSELEEKDMKISRSVSFQQVNEISSPAANRQRNAVEEDDIISRVCQMLSELIQMAVEDIKPTSTLVDLGIDSLLVTELLSEIQTRFEVDISHEQTMECADVAALCQLVRPIQSNGGDVMVAEYPSAEPKLQQEPYDVLDTTSGEIETQAATDVATVSYRAFAEAKSSYDKHADSTNFTGYCTNVFLIQSKLVVKYVVDAFAKLGVDLETIKAGNEVPIISFHPRHTKLIPQLYRVLIDAGLVEKSDSGKFLRVSTAVPSTSTGILHSSMLQQLPQHASETKLLATTASSKLAECLSGSADPISLIFKDATARELLTDVYTNAP
ncbi:MAG: hypothetical protein LQ340_006365, partial [Diploschistes diacapsis]